MWGNWFEIFVEVGYKYISFAVNGGKNWMIFKLVWSLGLFNSWVKGIIGILINYFIVKLF